MTVRQHVLGRPLQNDDPPEADELYGFIERDLRQGHDVDPSAILVLALRRTRTKVRHWSRLDGGKRIEARLPNLCILGVS